MIDLDRNGYIWVETTAGKKNLIFLDEEHPGEDQAVRILNMGSKMRQALIMVLSLPDDGVVGITTEGSSPGSGAPTPCNAVMKCFDCGCETVAYTEDKSMFSPCHCKGGLFLVYTLNGEPVNREKFGVETPSH
jgi:hypothetical protein